MSEVASLLTVPVTAGSRQALPENELEAIVPQQPGNLPDTGLERPLVMSLLAKTVARLGKAHLPVLCGKLRLSMSAMRETLAIMMAAQLIEVARRGDSDIDIEYQLTGSGQAFAAAALAECRYVGPAPVTLDAFRAVIARDAKRNAQYPVISDAALGAVLGDGPGDDILDPGVRAQLGAALHSGRALLLHGAPGCGKTTLANKLGRLLQGVVAVPYAILIDHQIVRFFDPAIHQAPPPPLARQFDERRNDARWLICQRPVVRVGAELTRDMLDCRFDASNGMYHAPVHVQASGGLLIIDDLGRQACSASDVLNRFMGPLDDGVDVLALQGGHAETVPFTVAMVFATSYPPQQLADPAQLRRIAYKIGLGPLNPASYVALLRRQCGLFQMPFDDTAARHLVQRLHAGSGQPMLASLPRELVMRIVDAAAFAGATPRLSAAALDSAWHSLFACCPPLGTASVAADHVLLGDKA